MAVIDASVWVAYFLPADKFHQTAVKMLKTEIAPDEQIHLPSIATIEVAGVIRRVTGLRAEAEDAVETMLKLDCKMWDIDTITLAPAAHAIASKFGCRGADACYVAVALLTRNSLWTFDKAQAECAQSVVQVASF